MWYFDELGIDTHYDVSVCRHLALGLYIYVLGSGGTPVFLGIHELCNSSLGQTVQLIRNINARLNPVKTSYNYNADWTYHLNVD